MSTPEQSDAFEDQTPEVLPESTDPNGNISSEQRGIFDRVTGLWSTDPRYQEPGGSAGDTRPGSVVNDIS